MYQDHAYGSTTEILHCSPKWPPATQPTRNGARLQWCPLAMVPARSGTADHNDKAQYYDLNQILEFNLSWTKMKRAHS